MLYKSVSQHKEVQLAKKKWTDKNINEVQNSVRSPQKRKCMVKLRESLGYSSMRVCMAILEKNGASNSCIIKNGRNVKWNNIWRRSPSNRNDILFK